MLSLYLSFGMDAPSSTFIYPPAQHHSFGTLPGERPAVAVTTRTGMFGEPHLRVHHLPAGRAPCRVSCASFAFQNDAV